MADKRISELTALTGANSADDDLLVIVDSSASETKSITLGELEKALGERDFSFADDDKLVFGDGDDLQIYHDGSASYIKDGGTGPLNIQGEELVLENPDGTNYFRAATDGSVKLYNSGNLKLNTQSTGIDVTGTVTADGLTVETEVTTQATAIALNGTSFADEERLSIDFQRGSNEGVRLSLEPDGSQTVGDFVIETGTFGSTSDRLRIEGNGDISFYEDTGATAKFFWDASAESLGIGTTSPAYKLDIQDASTPIFRMMDTTNDCTLLMYPQNTSAIFGTYSAHPLSLYTNSTEAVHIDSSGNVGIGTASPNAPLTVVSSSVAEFRVGNFGPSANSAIRISRNDTTVASGNPLGYLEFGGNDSTSNVDTAFAYVGAEASGTHAAGDNPTDLVFGTTADGSATPTERMRIDSSGNLLVGTTSDTIGDNTGVNTNGSNIFSDGTAVFGKNGNRPLILNRGTNDGDIVQFKKDGAVVGSIGTYVDALTIGTGDTGLRYSAAGDIIEPWNTSTNAGRDDAIDLGYSGGRFDDIYATNGTIQTSDANEKQDIEELSEAEQRVAVAAKGLLRKFRWKKSIEEKGDDARIHFGIIAQGLQAAFEAEGLDAGRYAMFIHTTWTDEETGEERSRMGVRYSELLAFIIAAI